jgi:hypothetical protein
MSILRINTLSAEQHKDPSVRILYIECAQTGRQLQDFIKGYVSRSHMWSSHRATTLVSYGNSRA